MWTKTRAATAGSALRGALDPRGMPGHLRVDTVRQGDRNGVKGANLVNIVDEVTQYEYVGAVPGISERFPVPLLEAPLSLFPFAVPAFHADNGSEYINHRVADMPDTLHIPRFTRSRARRSNDNALVEGKNAHVVRKWFGHDHIPQRFAEAVNEFALRELSPFLNFHRPCLFGTEYRDDRGRVRRKYRRADVMTPYAKLKSLSDAGACLSDGVTFAEPDRSALAVSDLDAVGRVNDAPAQDTLTADEASATMSGTTDDMLPGIPDGSAPFQHHVLIGQRYPSVDIPDTSSIRHANCSRKSHPKPSQGRGGNLANGWGASVDISG